MRIGYFDYLDKGLGLLDRNLGPDIGTENRDKGQGLPQPNLVECVDDWDLGLLSLFGY